MTSGFDEVGAGRIEGSSVESEQRDFLTVSDGVRFLWKGRAWVAAASLIGLALGLVFLVFTAITNPSTAAYRTAISMTMIGTAYPNGVPFAPSDLRSPIVLEAAFKQSKLPDYGMTIDKFSKSIDAQAHSPYVDTITARYRARAGLRGITPQEIKALEEEYRDELRAAKTGGVLITFTVDGKYGIPEAVGRQVVDSIPSVWAKEFSDALGITTAPIARSVAGVLDPKLAEALDYPLLFDYLETGVNQLDARLSKISGLPNATNVAVENLALSDLQRLSGNIRSFRIENVMRPLVDSGLSRDKEFSKSVYQNKASVLAIEEGAAERRSASISAVIRERTATDNPAASSQGSAQVTPSPLPGGGTSISAVGDAIMNKIVSLSIDNAGIEFRENLLKQKLEVEDSIAKKARERKLIELRLAGLRELDGTTPAASIEKQASVFDATAKAAISELNDIWRLANEVLKLIGPDSINDDKQLYASMPISDRMQKTPFYQSVFLWSVLGGLIIIGSLVGMLAYLLNSAIKQRPRISRALARR